MPRTVFAIGDQVVVKIANKADSVAVDTVGMVIGYPQQCYGRINFDRIPSGVYNAIGWVLFRTENGQVHTLATNQLELTTRGPNTLPKLTAHSPLRYPLQLVGPLPELSFWEGDNVTLNLNGKTDHVEVVCINYAAILGNDDDPTPPEERRGYHVMFIDGKRRLCVSASCLTLESRGKIWQLYHGQRPQFGSPDEEKSFHELVAPPATTASL